MRLLNRDKGNRSNFSCVHIKYVSFLNMNMMLDSGVHVDVQNMTITTDFLLLHLRKGGSLVMIELKVFFTISFNCKVFLFSLSKEKFSDASYIMTDGTLQEA